MNALPPRCGRAKPTGRFRLLLALLGCGGLFAGENGRAQSWGSLGSENAAEALARAIQNEPYSQIYGPLRVRAGAGVSVNYTDNVLLQSTKGRHHDRTPGFAGRFMAHQQTQHAQAVPGPVLPVVLKNPVLNADAPLVNPGSELAFNFFVGDFHIQVHERFSYQKSLFFNSIATENMPFYNVHDVGLFSQLNNDAGVDVTYNLHKAVLSAGYNHEDFDTSTSLFEYLNRASEQLTASASYALGDHLQTGLEARGSFNDYYRETILNDNWRARGGAFVDVTLWHGLSLRAGGGYDTADYDATALPNCDYASYYAYARIRQDTRLFSHALDVGRDNVLGFNANNLRMAHARYSISSPIVSHVDLGAFASVNAGEEYGGVYDERFTYYGAGFGVGYVLAKHWRTNLAYEFESKHSDLALESFQRNRVTLGIDWSF